MARHEHTQMIRTGLWPRKHLYRNGRLPNGTIIIP